MDKTVSPFGKRMLKRWVMAPLLEPHEVQLRTEAVDDLMLNKKFVEVFQEGLSKLPDIERMVNRIYNLTDR
jgi:DNA mismatch repair protein MSH6